MLFFKLYKFSEFHNTDSKPLRYNMQFRRAFLNYML